MDPQREKAIVTVLNTNKAQGIPYYQTQQQLLKDGYTKSEIVYALYSDPYDADSDKPRPPHPLADLYAQYPGKAHQVAEILLQDQRIEDANQTTADIAAGAAGVDIQSRSYYDVLAADRLGIPYFTLLFLGFIPLVIGLKFHWSNNTVRSITAIYQLFVSGIFAYKLFQERLQIKREQDKINRGKA